MKYLISLAFLMCTLCLPATAQNVVNYPGISGVEGGVIEYWPDGFPKKIDDAYGFVIQDNWNNASVLGNLGWVSAGSGNLSAANQTVNTGEEATGVVYAGTNSTSGSYGGLFLNYNKVPIGRMRCWVEFYNRLLALDDGVDTYQFQIGMFKDPAHATNLPSDGVYFGYDKANDGDFWTINSADNSTTTKTVTTAVPTAGGDAYTKFRIYVDPQNSTAQYWIDGTYMGAISTNLPSNDARRVAFGWNAQKTGGSTNNQVSYSDYFRAACLYNTPRL